MKILSSLGMTILTVTALAQTTSTQETLTLELQNATLNGTLTIPSSNKKIPIALIIAGSGATDQNGNSLGSAIQPNSYKFLAEALANQGIATLRYDKRGIGKSRTSQTENQVRFEDFSNDASALLEQLKKDPRFSSLYIIGHSEGSLLGMLAAQKTTITGYISLAGAGRPADEILIEQLTPQLTPAMLKETKRVLERLKQGQTTPTKDIQLPPNLITALLRDSIQPYLISWFRYDPASEIKKLNTKMLILQGNTDIQVSLLDANRLATAIGQSASILENVNHTLKPATLEPASQNRAYTDPNLPVATSLIKALTNFIEP
jgi:uncharacterized protein